MTIKPDKNMSKNQHELIKFMQDFNMPNSLAAKMIGCREHQIHRYRMGNSKFTSEELTTLKTNYKRYMQEKLDSIKV